MYTSHVPLAAGLGVPKLEKIFGVGAGAVEDSAFFIPKLENIFEVLELAGGTPAGVVDVVAFAPKPVPPKMLGCEGVDGVVF